MPDDEDVKKEPEQEVEDDVVEFEFNDDGEEDLKKTLKKLRADLKQAKKEKEEYLTGWQKERADFANYKKEEENRKMTWKSAVEEKVISRFLAVLDSFSMAFANREAWEKVDANWRRGVEYIHDQLEAIFEEFGVKSFGAEGDTFDPNLHHSVDSVATNQKELDHKVAQVVQKGYQLGGRTLRPAQVKLYDFKHGQENGTE